MRSLRLCSSSENTSSAGGATAIDRYKVHYLSAIAKLHILFFKLTTLLLLGWKNHSKNTPLASMPMAIRDNKNWIIDDLRQPCAEMSIAQQMNRIWNWFFFFCIYVGCVFLLSYRFVWTFVSRFHKPRLIKESFRLELQIYKIHS